MLKGPSSPSTLITCLRRRSRTQRHGIGLDKTTVDCDASGVPVFDTSTMQTVTAAGPGSFLLPETRAISFRFCMRPQTKAASPAKMWPVSLQENPLPAACARTAWHRIHRSADRNSGRRLVGARDRSFRCGSGRFSSIKDAHASCSEPWSAGCLRGHRDGRLLGAEMIAPAAEHLGHLLAWALAESDDDRADARDAVLPSRHRGGIAHSAARP